LARLIEDGLFTLNLVGSYQVLVYLEVVDFPLLEGLIFDSSFLSIEFLVVLQQQPFDFIFDYSMLVTVEV